jgi:hypothetical protein
MVNTEKNRIDAPASRQGPHNNQALDRDDLDAIQFNHDFARTCLEEARKHPVGSAEHKENLAHAAEFLDAALEATPYNPQFHFSRGLVSAEMGELTPAVNSFRNAVIYNPLKAAEYMTLLNIGSEELNRTAPGTISATTLKIQSLLARGDNDAAFSAAHTDANGAILRGAKPSLWNVQLMRVAAMQIGAERAYVEVLNLLEEKGFLDARDPDYLPIGYAVTEQMRQEMRDETNEVGGLFTKPGIWNELKVHYVEPINGTAVKVGAKPHVD